MKAHVPESEIRFIVGNMHVGTCDFAVVRDFARRFRTFNRLGKYSKAFRKRCYRFALKVHRANRKLFTDYRF